MNNNAMLTGLQKMLRTVQLDYRNDAVYGTMTMLDAAVNEDLSFEDAVNDIIQNTDVEVQVK